jgi:hypothetical protein
MKTTLNIDDTVMDRLRRESARTGRAMSELVETALHGARYLTWGSCYEFLMVVTHPRVLRKPRSGSAAGEFLTAVRQSPGLSMLSPTDRHAAVLAEVMSASRRSLATCGMTPRPRCSCVNTASAASVRAIPDARYRVFALPIHRRRRSVDVRAVIPRRDTAPWAELLERLTAARANCCRVDRELGAPVPLTSTNA